MVLGFERERKGQVGKSEGKRSLRTDTIEERRIDDRESSLTAAFAFLLSRRSLADEETTNSGRHMADYSPQDVESRSFCPPLTKYHVDRRMHFRSFRNSLRGFCEEKEISKVVGKFGSISRSFVAE